MRLEFLLDAWDFREGKYLYIIDNHNVWKLSKMSHLNFHVKNNFHFILPRRFWAFVMFEFWPKVIRYIAYFSKFKLPVVVLLDFTYFKRFEFQCCPSPTWQTFVHEIFVLEIEKHCCWCVLQFCLSNCVVPIRFFQLITQKLSSLSHRECPLNYHYLNCVQLYNYLGTISNNIEHNMSVCLSSELFNQPWTLIGDRIPDPIINAKH